MSKLFRRKALNEASSLLERETISAEIFGKERFGQHAHSLAQTQLVTDDPVSVYSFIDRLDANSAALRQNYEDILSAVEAGKSVTPAAEWLIDNYHLVEQHVHQTKADLPTGFYRQLPKLAGGHLAGHPRIFGVVWAYVAHTDSHFDPGSLTDFINAYQDVQPLSIGELWATAISLRLILIENMRRIADRIVLARKGREAADRLADGLSQADETATSLNTLLSEAGHPVVTPPFAVQFILRSREDTPLTAAALDWVKQKLTETGNNFDNAVTEEHHRQGAANVTIRNIVTSLRLISDVNWESWFDSVSVVDRVMRTHGNYGAMDFPSRTLYRTAIEEIARGSIGDELAVAHKALSINGIDPGYHLIGAGRNQFESSLGFKPPLLRRWRDRLRAAGLAGYLSAITLTTALMLLVGLWTLSDSSIPALAIIFIAILALFPASDFAIAIVNFVMTKLLNASALPGFALRDGVPSHLRTMVAIPMLLTSLDDVDDMVGRLEVHFLSNADGDLFFALVTDWTDAEAEHLPSDEALLTQAVAGIEQLNARHRTNQFLLLHRGRKWNPRQAKWMGWERKRGKLHELNRLLRGATDTNFIKIVGSVPENVRYVITLDADTRLPRDAARRLIGKMAHPLNQPRFDAKLGRVVEGYGILQPRVTPALPVGRQGSEFQRIYSASRGIDPYVFTVSDVYQDLFGEGSFAGKGIYDIDAFEAALFQKIPENTMLSHDLFEGVFARAALVTDVEVVEEYPERYAVDASRQHRWARGDWQLLPWMVAWRRSSIPPVGLWKMVDNLRRSITPVAVVSSLLIVWLIAPFTVSLWWTGFILASMLLPQLMPVLSTALFREQSARVSDTLASLFEDMANTFTQFGANVLFLAHRAGLMADAIARTFYRLVFSHRYLLEWTTAAQANSGHRDGLQNSYSLMASSVVAALLTVSIAAYRGGNHWMLLMPFAIAWFIAPAIALHISRSQVTAEAQASTVEDHKNLRRVAWRTWRFFTTFVTAQENMLPPDNFQETPSPVIAHRTSPTNIGLYLLAVASAREFGWIGLSDCVAKIEATMATLKRLEKLNGHLYNWYDTRDLRPLDPKYISTVDSGNLAGHLIALSNICLQWNLVPADARESLIGIEDILVVLNEDLSVIPNDRRNLKPLRKQFEQQADVLRGSLRAAAEKPETIAIKLIDIALQAANLRTTLTAISTAINTPQAAHLLDIADELRAAIESHFSDSNVANAQLQRRLNDVAAQARLIAMEMDFGFLFEPQRQLLSIGYRVPESMRDESCYDMLASEARLASFFAIAKGDLRTRHWFRLGRSVTAVKGGAVLMSWSGSMFEYLMPSLVMRAPAKGLLDQTTRLIVQRQIEFGRQNGTPWGISESAFNARDIEFTYQYSNFGVPGLGLKRGLADNLVIAPYATGLAAMVAPHAAAANYDLLAREGARGEYGFYEALDYTSARVRQGEAKSIVKAYFSHHQGMTIVAILNAVKNGEMRKHFHDEPIIRAAELLLQERAPRNVPIAYKWAEKTTSKPVTGDNAAHLPRIFEGLSGGPPATHILSNGHYTTLLTAAGGGQSTWNDLAITRWREDAVKDDWGSFVYLKDMKSGLLWSSGHMPTTTLAGMSLARFFEEKAEFNRQDGVFTTTTEHVVSPEDNCEARRITVMNNGLTARNVEFTTYAELVLAPQAADITHPAFSKLFVQTEYLPEIDTLVATRRRRSSGDPEIWVAQFVMTKGPVFGEPSFETDRAKFLGAGRNTRAPEALDANAQLSKTSGHVLDAIFALRHCLKIAPGRQVSFTIWTLVANSRQAVLDLVDRHRQDAAFDRAMTLAWTQAQIQLRHLQISVQDAHLYQTLASHLIYANAALRLPSTLLMQTMGSQSALWPQGISGDRPILLVRIDDVEDIDLVRELLEAFEYLKAKNLLFDLVVLNDRMSSYVQDLQTLIEDLVRKTGGQDARSRVFALRSDLIAPETLRVLPSVSRVVLLGRRGDLAGQLARVRELPLPRPNQALVTAPARSVFVNIPTLEFYNGHGGFDTSGTEYVILPRASNPTPQPWINVIANPQFGFHAAADGGGYTWFGNARENQLTVWGNDATSNPASEVFYVRDEDSGKLISPTLSPIKSGEGTHLTRHGFGYSTFERQVDGLTLELTQCVPLADAVKLSRLRLFNTDKVSRTLSITYYAELVLGSSRAATAPFVSTLVDEPTGALLASNRWKNDGSEQVVFADMAGRQTAWTGNRLEFLGKFGSLAAPAALAKATRLSKQVGAGFDPCFAMQCEITLLAGQSTDIVVMLGAGANAAGARELIARYRSCVFEDILRDVRSHWKDTLGTVQVKTPDRAFDIMMNGWLLYQTLACRMWARSGLYQASGAYGFRDQLQDSMALLHACPDIARAHILRAAARQFPEGDVQHWWLPETGMGIRTRISDDTVWLASCVHHYVTTTGDHALLDEHVSYIEGQSLMPGEHDVFSLPMTSGLGDTLYEHCARGLDIRLAAGEHGLPLIGTGDWNDGMNRVGENGKGESVWLGWFLHKTLSDFEVISKRRGDGERVQKWSERQKTLKAALESHGWDGQWYRRAFYDDGTALGSADDQECRIDAIAQSWAVLSGVASAQRGLQAMDMAYQHLVKADDGVALLFAPPFDKGESDPGYIKAYPPGIRENGGQYTHGVIWSIFAHAALHQPERAMQLFSMINPINHGKNADDVQRYKVEPYVIAADVYSVAPHVGRGGWTWYTGSAGWFYRAGLEAILGVTRQGNEIHVKPCVPADWDDVMVTIRFDKTWYDIQLVRRSLRADERDAKVKVHAPGHYVIHHEHHSTRRTIVLGLASGFETKSLDLTGTVLKSATLG
jgi:cyclic beta-1,2-glucan synthetase